MDRLRPRELKSCLQLLERTGAAGDTWTGFAESVVAALPALVASEITTLSVCDLRSGQRRVFGSAGSLLGDRDKASFDRHFNQHPLVQYHAYQRGRGVRRISDSVPQSRFLSSALYDEYYRHIGIDHAVAVPIRVDDQVLVSLVLNRCLPGWIVGSKRRRHKPVPGASCARAQPQSSPCRSQPALDS